MAEPSLFCIPLSDSCRLMTEWAVIWSALGTIATFLFGYYGLKKIRSDLDRLAEQRDKELRDSVIAAGLKRTEFFLSQHRRLFDDEDLYAVLCLIDGDEPGLTAMGMADKKRKFLTFYEEMALLVKSGQIEKSVAFYMFGHYAICAKHGKNFRSGIDLSPKHWGLFFKFASAAESYRRAHLNGPPDDIHL